MMYHDQGQIATKLLGFNKGVTVTAGLKTVFTTPAHGTAFDIVGQGDGRSGRARVRAAARGTTGGIARPDRRLPTRFAARGARALVIQQSMAGSSPGWFDAVLIVAFGGPQGRADIRPFLERVLRGRRVTPERVEEVAHHYELFDGVSPITS